MKAKQLVLGERAPEFKKYWRESGRKVHGGDHAVGNRKTARPFSARKPLHVVMRSAKAIGSRSFRLPKFYGKIVEIIESHAKHANIRLHQFSVNGNHLHLLIRAQSRKDLQTFLRSLPGHLARLMTGAKRGNVGGKFWDGLIFTRIVEWGKDFGVTLNYVLQNIFEAAGLVKFRPRLGMRSSKLFA